MKRMIVLATTFGLLTTTAFAHAFVDEASPRVGSSVTAAPKEIRITYTEEVEPAFCHVALFAGDGKPVTIGALTVDSANHKQLIAPVTGAMQPGHYEVRWTAVSVDTHHTEGHFPFDYQP